MSTTLQIQSEQTKTALAPAQQTAANGPSSLIRHVSSGSDLGSVSKSGQNSAGLARKSVKRNDSAANPGETAQSRTSKGFCRRIPSTNNMSAFTPVFKSQNGSQSGACSGRQSEVSNNASKSFW